MAEISDWEHWLSQQGYQPPYQWTSLSGGMNNQAYKLETSGSTLCLKHYRSHWRLEREFRVLSLLAPGGWTPQPLLHNSELKVGLYEFLEGTPVAPTATDCSQALEFLESMQQLRENDLPPASDACLDPVEHWRVVQARLPEMDEAFHSDWEREWRPLLERTDRLVPPDPPAPGELIVSPSDFGFHNALRRADGRLQFFDLEYAGMDDPAKVACDFFAQPRLPAPLESLGLFLNGLAPKARTRVSWMWPVTVAKWACIILKRRTSADLAQQRQSAQWLARRYSQVADLLEGSLGLPVNGPQGE